MGGLLAVEAAGVPLGFLTSHRRYPHTVPEQVTTPLLLPAHPGKGRVDARGD
ncbi:hypothetical protein [Corynebacterium comes]|uniref:hypothetical protein n=1 Tax=Corynebacterium comes TaxID=2675218 RepID=UPI0012E30A23|nr:hypothetical protein [Corynebacterium comes]